MMATYPGAGHAREAGVGVGPAASGYAPQPAKRIGLFIMAFAATAAVLLIQPALDPGLREAFDRTFGFQAGRDSPFSVWGQEGLDGLRIGLEVATAALAVALAFVPRRKSVVQLAALGAALLIATQLTLQHWFYLYIVWFFPLAIAALAALEPAQTGARSRTWEIDSASPSGRTSTTAAITQTSSSAVSN
jgi:hypothetical protein